MSPGEIRKNQENKRKRRRSHESNEEVSRTAPRPRNVRSPGGLRRQFLLRQQRHQNRRLRQQRLRRELHRHAEAGLDGGLRRKAPLHRVRRNFQAVCGREDRRPHHRGSVCRRSAGRRRRHDGDAAAGHLGRGCDLHSHHCQLHRRHGWLRYALHLEE